MDGLNPRRLFELDFHAALRTWKSKGERLLVFMDVNEHVINGKFMRRLMEDSMLDLVEETHRHWEEEPAHTYINGKDPIDCGLRTKDVEITGFLMQPYSRSVGDHRTIILDATTLTMVGSYQHIIVYPPCRRLTIQNPRCVTRYMQRLEEQMDAHRMDERLDELERKMTSYPETEEQQAESERLDMQMIEIQCAAEAKCRQIRKPDLPFSMPVRYWGMRRRSYNDLKRCHEGKVRNVANVMNRAKANRIPDPRSLSLQQYIDGAAYCKGQMHKLRLKSRGLRRVHLRDRLIRAEELGDEEGMKGVRRVIQREENSRMWYFINRVTDDPKSGGVLRVERYVNGELETNTEQEDMVSCIQEETEFRFLLAHSAKITNTTIRREIGVSLRRPGGGGPDSGNNGHS